MTPHLSHIDNRKYRCSPQSPDCKIYENETIKRPGSSNFIAHSQACKSIPAAKTWARFQIQDGAETDGDRDIGAGSNSGIQAQRTLMHEFGVRGLEYPEKNVTRKGFREHLVKGIVEDDLPYSFGEKGGMKKLFEYVLPCGFGTPSHQTVRQDIDLLYDQLNEKLNHTLQVSPWPF